MFFSRASLLWIGAAFAVSGLAACGGSASVPNASGAGGFTPQSIGRTSAFSIARAVDGDSWIDPSYAAGIADATKSVLYVADYKSGVVNIYPATGKAKKPVGAIKGIKGPNGIAVDSHHNLYVTENSNGDVLVFLAGKTKSSFVLSDTGHSPESVAVADDGTVYVANHDFPQTGVSVAVYKSYKSKTSSSTLTDATIAYPYYVTADKAGNVYLTYSDQGGGNDVGEFPKGSTALTLLFGNAPNFQGIGVDPKGDLVIDDYNDKAIDIYAPGSKGITSSIPIANSAQSFAFSTTGKDLFTADFDSNTVGDYAYPGGKAVETITDADEHWGVAVSPAAPFGTWHP